MRNLTWTFSLLALVGLVTNNWAVVLLALGWAVFSHWAELVFARQDKQWLADPRNAVKQADASEILAAEGSECSCMYVPAEVINLQAQSQLSNPNEDPR